MKYKYIKTINLFIEHEIKTIQHNGARASCNVTWENSSGYLCKPRPCTSCIFSSDLGKEKLNKVNSLLK